MTLQNFSVYLLVRTLTSDEILSCWAVTLPKSSARMVLVVYKVIKVDNNANRMANYYNLQCEINRCNLPAVG